MGVCGVEWSGVYQGRASSPRSAPLPICLVLVTVCRVSWRLPDSFLGKVVSSPVSNVPASFPLTVEPVSARLPFVGDHSTSSLGPTSVKLAPSDPHLQQETSPHWTFHVASLSLSLPVPGLPFPDPSTLAVRTSLPQVLPCPLAPHCHTPSGRPQPWSSPAPRLCPLVPLRGLLAGLLGPGSPTPAGPVLLRWVPRPPSGPLLCCSPSKPLFTSSPATDDHTSE